MEEDGVTIAEYLGSLSKKELEKSNEYNGLCYEGKVRRVVNMDSSTAESLTKGLLTKETKEILQDIANWQVKMLITGGEEFCSITKDVKSQREITLEASISLGKTVKATIPSDDPRFNIEIYFTKS